MYTCVKTIVANKDISPRVAMNFVANLVKVKSSVYFALKDREINAKSVLGIISINIKNGDEFTITTRSVISQLDAENDINQVVEFLNGISQKSHWL